MKLSIFGIIFVLMSLAGCNALPTKQTLSETAIVEQDLVEIEKLAAASYASSNWLESEKHYSILVKRAPDQSLYWFRLGNIYAQTNHPDASIVAYREALERDPALTNAWYNLGVIQLKQAVYSFNEMQLHVDPQDPVAVQSKKILDGIITLIQGDNPE